ncbi:MAG: hypothetical protein R3301_05635 [Saprospiraceae bacterium]|nr:hypothetical protein [Saprospiraceae bacterium]
MRKRFPVHGWFGALVTGIFWWVNWGLTGERTHWAFFPLWLGYILAVDGLSVVRGRPSLVRQGWRFVLLFILSAPVWWIFELINRRLDYWRYEPAGFLPPGEYYFWSTLCFSTVIPAIFVTANFLASVPWFRRHHLRLRAGKTATGRIIYFVLGCAMLIAVLIWPAYGMALLWMALFFILDPINHWLGRPSLLRNTAGGDWRPVLLLFAAALTCGFFWEMWNYWSWPRWVYTFPFLDWLPVFEMPILGYLGYLPFGLEVYAFVALLGSTVVKSVFDR